MAPTFRNFLDGVSAHQTLNEVIQLYELGLSRVLLAEGMKPWVLCPRISSKGSLVIRQEYALLLEQGMPLIKVKLLKDNPRQLPQLHRWKQLVARRYPAFDPAMVERHLFRVTEPADLDESFHIKDTHRTLRKVARSFLETSLYMLKELGHRAIKKNRDVELILKSGEFDKEYYLKSSGLHPQTPALPAICHYLHSHEKWQPNVLFKPGQRNRLLYPRVPARQNNNFVLALRRKAAVR